MDFLFGSIDTWDIIVVTLIGAVGLYFFFKYRSDVSSVSKPSPMISVATSAATKTDNSLIARMKAEDRNILVLFGSQTGTAEELAGRLAKDLVRYGKKALVMDPEDLDLDDFERLVDLNNPLLILCVATYGEGDPTDNAQSIYEHLKNTDIDFTGLKYAVFGLGNKTYEHFNAVGKFFDSRLEEIGAERVFELGLGDDDANLEEDFMRWREAFLPALAHSFGWEIVADGGMDRQYKLQIIEEPSTVFTGEFGRIGAYEKQRPPFDQKNPFLSEIVEHYELHGASSERNCMHVDFSIKDSRIRYEAGDHLAVFPTNDSEIVEKLGKLLDQDLNIVFKLINLDEESSKRHPFPCPCSYRTALTHYVDICAPVKSHVLKALVEYTTDEEQKRRLTLLSTATEEGLKEYSQFVGKERRSIVDILDHFNTCKPPIDHLLELLPRLQVRYYSISSSPKLNSDVVSITAVTTRYNIGERLIKGVCTNYLSRQIVGSKTPIFVRKSTMRLPHRPNIPVIMIGPGTGFAPFRGFLQERAWQKEQGKEVGDMILFFGCRHPEHDYIYQNEIEKYVEDQVLTDLYVAFSRYQENKIYVQHLMWEQKDRVWELLQNNANIYVCGDARNMARDVQNTFLRIFREVGGMDVDAAQKYFKELERQRRYQADVWS
uniref:NADPH--cytochrome P450 reductase n=1 Tax=Panagrolaimus sp. JU765 TaxID=591449 RepID=A0AC34Q6H4_9BILA